MIKLFFKKSFKIVSCVFVKYAIFSSQTESFLALHDVLAIADQLGRHTRSLCNCVNLFCLENGYQFNSSPASKTYRKLRPVHTTTFSNESGTVLLRFHNDSFPHLSFPYRFCPSTLQSVSVMKTLLNLILSYILPPFFLHYFPRDKVVPPR